jgi:hypothetical protein
MSEIEQRRADRLRVMAEIFKETGASQATSAALWPIRERLSFSDEYMGAIVDYLDEEGLIEPLRTMTGTHTPMQTNVTHLGIKEMELSQERPEKPTDHFPPSVSITVNGNVTASPFQVGNVGSTQHSQVGDVTISTDAKKAITDFVSEFEAKATELEKEKSPEVVAEIAAEVATIKAQVNSPKPKKHFIKECLHSTRTILEIGAGGAVTAGLLALIALIVL